MLQDPKVSVVVPIYKVENYIHRCLESIVKQTYHNLEIILVNDGSPDQSGAIAEKYRMEDSRIIVIHKTNGGLSDARNYGMKQVTGEFTLFVDSDDWLEKDMIEVMVNNSIKHKADVVQSAFYYAYDDQLLLDIRYDKQHQAPNVLNKQSLMYELVKNETVKNFAWGKLYKTKLIRDIPFEKGVLFEDVFWAHHVMHRVDTYLILHQPMYYYYQRDDSIVAAYTPKNLDMIRGLLERHRFIEKYYPDLTDDSYKVIVSHSLIHYNLLVANRKKDKKGINRRYIESYLQTNYERLKQAVQSDKHLAKQLYLFSLHPYLNIFYLGIRKGLKTLKLVNQPQGLKRVQ